VVAVPGKAQAFAVYIYIHVYIHMGWDSLSTIGNVYWDLMVTTTITV